MTSTVVGVSVFCVSSFLRFVFRLLEVLVWAVVDEGTADFFSTLFLRLFEPTFGMAYTLSIGIW